MASEDPAALFGLAEPDPAHTLGGLKDDIEPEHPSVVGHLGESLAQAYQRRCWRCFDSRQSCGVLTARRMRAAMLMRVRRGVVERLLS